MALDIRHSRKLSKIISVKLLLQFYNFLNRKWYFDRVYNQLIGQQSLNISYNFSYKSLDRGIIEKLGPSGIISSIRYTINHLNNLQSGQIYHYLFLFLIFSVIFLFITICFNNMFLSLNIVVFLFLLNSLIFSDIDSKSI